MDFRENVPLAPYTTFRIGGPARWFAEASSDEDVLEAVQFARSKGLPLFVLGGGSNLLVSDEGFPGLVLRMALRGIRKSGDKFYVAAGEDWDGFVSHAVGLNYGGIECLAGIPGTVGGTPVQNVGAYGQEVADTILGVSVLDLETLTIEGMQASNCGFAYRRSIFNSTERGRYIVTAVVYNLHLDAKPSLSYADLKRYFQDKQAPGLAEAANAVREIRRGKGMLIVEGDADCRSAGSFFKNPVVTPEHYARIAANNPSGVPSYPAPEEQVKLPAAWLVEQAGFHKGYALGEAGISSRHTLALINRGHARAVDVFALRDRIIAGVEEKFGIHLEPEPVLLG
ncbi:UDP-N-acetylmuramate dehydrogenase [Silvibacterium acidisoli]|uniref:UDP-N-acetylmuramate dehydrogenase n=1 Tax=Acidobacteriaceae bacterium ZG23-2 TaxID=2883246 RepID=UPI00406C3F31